MSLTSRIKQWFIKTLPGMNNKTEDLELQERWVELSQNTRYEDEPGTLVKRPPIVYYNETSVGTGGMVGLYRLYLSGGSNIAIGIHGNNAYVGTDSTGAMTSIRGDLTESKRTSFVTYKDLLIAGNGFDPCWVYDGSSDNVTWELGACKARPPVAGGALDADADYYYSVTFLDSDDIETVVSGAKSNTITTTATNKKTEITHIPLGPVWCAKRRIYRTEGGGTGLKLLTTVNNNYDTVLTSTNNLKDAGGALDVFDDAPDGDLGGAIGGATDEMPRGNILQIHRERLFVAGDQSNRNTIYYSHSWLPWIILKDTDLAYLEISPEDGDLIMGIPIQMGTMCCIKQNTIRKLHVTSAVSGANPDTWYAEDPIAFTGARAQWSVVQTPHGIVFLGWNSWYLFNGAHVAPQIDEFDTQNILEANYGEVFAYYSQQGVLLAAYTDASTADTHNNRIMRYNFKRQALSVDTVSVNVIHGLEGGGEAGDLLYGSSTDGYIYKAVYADYWYRLQNKAQMNAGTKGNIFVGGTEGAPYMEIGSVVAADALPNDVCVFWDNPTTTPGAGWEEIEYPKPKFLRVDDTETFATDVSVGTSDGASKTYNIRYMRLFKKITGTTEYGFPRGAIVFFQDNPPVGWQAFPKDTYVIVADKTLAGSSGTVTLNPVTDGAAGTDINIDNTFSLQLIKKTGEEAGWNGQDSYAYVPAIDAVTTLGFEDVTGDYDERYFLSKDGAGVTTHDGGFNAEPMTGAMTEHIETATSTYPTDVQAPATYASGSYYSTVSGSGPGASWGLYSYLLVGYGDTEQSKTSYLYSTHMFDTPQDIGRIVISGVVKGKTKSGSSANSATGTLTVQQYKAGAWTSTGVAYSRSGTGDNSWKTTNVDGDVTVALTDVEGIRVVIQAYVRENPVPSYWGGPQEAEATLYGIQAYSMIGGSTIKMSRKILGHMTDYNDAYVNPETNGIWVSPASQIQAESLDKLFWNETKVAADDVVLFMRTAADAASLDSVSAVASDDGGDLLFTAASHGLSVNDRVNFVNSTTVPGNVDDAVMYYVQARTDNTFKIAVTASAASAVAYSSAGATVKFKRWLPVAGLSDPNGTALGAIAANAWLEYCITFIAADTTIANPRVSTIAGYAVKYSYGKGAATAESAVEFVYDIGFRNFDAPLIDKIYKKILTWHEGEEGTLQVFWKVDLSIVDANGIRMNEYDPDTTGLKSFTIDLEQHPTRWESFFPPIATGRAISFRIYKNDLFDFKLKEIKGIYGPEPLII